MKYYQVLIKLSPTKNDLKKYGLQKFLAMQVKHISELISEGDSDLNIINDDAANIGEFIITEEDTEDVELKFEFDKNIVEEIEKEVDKREINKLLDNI